MKSPASWWRRAAILFDAPLAVIGVLLGFFYFGIRWAMPLRRRRAPPRLLVLDTSYSLPVLRQRSQLYSVTCRDLDGFFDHVWTCHPLTGASADDPPAERVGPVVEEPLAPRHTFVTGRVGRYRWLSALPLTNFLLAQFAVHHRLGRIVRREGIAAIRIGDPFYQGLWGVLLARTHKIPLVLRVGAPWDSVWETSRTLAYPTLIPSYRIQKAIDRFTLPRMDLVAGTNQDNLNYALANGASQERTTVFPYGNLIDPVHFVAPEKRRSADADLVRLGIHRTPFLLYVARLERLKFHEDALAAFLQVRARVPDVRLVFAGDGRLRGELEAKAERLGIRDAVVFAGSRDQEWVASVLPRAIVVLALSAGRALVEAMLSGRPVVAYDFEWHREILEPGVSGVLVSSGDVDALAAGILELLENAHEANRLGTAARCQALQQQNHATLTAHEQAHYARLIGIPEVSHA